MSNADFDSWPPDGPAHDEPVVRRARVNRSGPGPAAMSLLVVLTLCFLVVATRSLAGVSARAADLATLRAELPRLDTDGVFMPFSPRLAAGEILTPLSLGNTESVDEYPLYTEGLWVLHEAAVRHVAGRLEYSPAAVDAAVRRARASHSTVAREYAEAFRRRYAARRWHGDSSAGFVFKLSGAAGDFSKVLGERLCVFTAFALGLSEHHTAAFLTGLVPDVCGVVLAEVLIPFTTWLQDEGLLLDYVAAEEYVRHHVFDAIAQLATARAEFDHSLRLRYEREILSLFTSTAALDLRARPELIAGFDLLKHFQYRVDAEARELIVGLPAPEILSVEPHVRIAGMRDGWFISVDVVRLNDAIRTIEARAVRHAEDAGLLEEARRNAVSVVSQLLQPLASSPFGAYGVRVEFADGVTG